MKVKFVVYKPTVLYGTLTPTGIGSANVHPIGYHTLLWLWMSIFGESLVSARLLSVLAGVITLCLVYLTALEVTDLRTALLSTIFASFHRLELLRA